MREVHNALGIAPPVGIAAGGEQVASTTPTEPTPPPEPVQQQPLQQPQPLQQLPPQSTLTPAPEPIPPQAYDVSSETQSNTPIDIQFSGQDDDPNSLLTASIIDEPANGQLSEIDQSTGIVTYTPNPDFAGEDQFTYAVNDGTADSNAATVSISVIQEGGEGTMVSPEPIPSPEPEPEPEPIPSPSQANDIRGILDIDANNFKGILKIESNDNTGHFSGTVKFFGFPVDPIEGQYNSDSQVVTFTRPLPPNAFQSYTG